MKKKYNVLMAKKNSKGEFVKNNKGKTVYDNWGFIAVDDKGYKKLCLKSWQGDIWFSLFEIKEGEQQQPQGDIDNNDIPF